MTPNNEAAFRMLVRRLWLLSRSRKLAESLFDNELFLEDDSDSNVAECHRMLDWLGFVDWVEQPEGLRAGPEFFDRIWRWLEKVGPCDDGDLELLLRVADRLEAMCDEGCSAAAVVFHETTKALVVCHGQWLSIDTVDTQHGLCLRRVTVPLYMVRAVDVEQHTGGSAEVTIGVDTPDVRNTWLRPKQPMSVRSHPIGESSLAEAHSIANTLVTNNPRHSVPRDLEAATLLANPARYDRQRLRIKCTWLRSLETSILLPPGSSEKHASRIWLTPGLCESGLLGPVASTDMMTVTGPTDRRLVVADGVLHHGSAGHFGLCDAELYSFTLTSAD